MAINITNFISGAQNLTTDIELYTYVGNELYIWSVAFIFIITMLFMLLLGLILINRDRGNYYAIFIFSMLIMGILFFFTFFFPIIPLLIDKILGGIV